MRAELVARGDFVADHPDLTQTVVEAYVRAAHWSADEANRAQIIHDAARGAMPEAIIAREYAAATYPWRERFSPVFRPEIRSHYQSVADYALSRGLVHAQVKPEDLLDDRFVRQALKKLKLEDYWAGGRPA